MNDYKPLSGYRVVELSTFMAAPSCGRQLAEAGADVIKVEMTGGDPWRYFGKSMGFPVTEDEATPWDLYNSGKRRLAIDINSADSRKVLQQLLETADIFLTNQRPASLKKIKLDYDSLKERYPKLIYALVTGFGEKGPDADLPGFDVSAFWARSGFLVDLVKPDEYPIYAPSGLGDLIVGNTLYGGICTALLHRAKTGQGDKISVSLYGAAVWYLGLIITAVQDRYGSKYPKTRFEGYPTAIPYRSQDGGWIMLSLVDHDRYWTQLCRALAREDLIEDQRFSKLEYMTRNRAELVQILEAVFATRPLAEWTERLKKADVPHDRLCHFADVLQDRQAWANDFLYEWTFQSGKSAVLPRTPVLSELRGPAAFARGPLLGEHTHAVLQELGYAEEQIRRMQDTEIIKVRE